MNELLKKLGALLMEEQALTDKIKNTPQHFDCFLEDIEADDYEHNEAVYEIYPLVYEVELDDHSTCIVEVL